MPKRPAAKKPATGWPRIAVACLLFAAVAATVVLTVGSYGITTDEPIYISQGLLIGGWFRSAAESFAAGDFAAPFRRQVLDDVWYAGKDQQPPLVKAMSGLAATLMPERVGSPAPLRVPGGLLFAAAVTCLYFFCSARWGMRAGLAAGFSFFLLPRAFAHAHYATLDIPVAGLVLMTALAFWKTGESPRWGWGVVTGGLFGLALLAKLNALLLMPVLLAWAAVFHRQGMLRRAVSLLAIGPAVFLLGWPWLWHDTAARLADYVRFHSEHYAVDVYYLGHTYHYAPWHYPFVLTGATVPVAVLALMALGIVVAAARARTGSAETLLLVGAAAYLAVSALPFAPKYNGVRLFMPAFPFLAGLAGLGFERFTVAVESGLQGLGARGRWFAPLAGVAIFASAAAGIITTYPYQLAYYNELTRGVKGARRAGLETVYWGGPYLAALEELNRGPVTVYVIPKGAASYLSVYRDAGMLRPNVRVRARVADPAENLEQIKQSDLVMFQCAQSEFDEIAWALYRRKKPAWGVYLKGVPLLLAFDSRQALEVMAHERH